MSNCPPLDLKELIKANENLRHALVRVGVNAADAAEKLQRVIEQLDEHQKPKKLDDVIELLKKYDNNQKNS